VPQKFNTFNTFNTFAAIAAFAIFANFDLTLEYPSGKPPGTPRPSLTGTQLLHATSPSPGSTGEGWGEGRSGGEVSSYTGFKLIPGSCSSRARWQAAHCPGTISSKPGASVVQISIA